MNQRHKRRIPVRNDVAKIQGSVYRATVLQVMERDNDGTPRTFRLLRDDESVNLEETPEGQRAFEVVFARVDLQRRRH